MSIEKKKSRVEIVFVVDPPGLVIEAILLVSSIRKFLPDVKVTACVPYRKTEKIPPQLVHFFKMLEVDIREMSAAPFLTPYPHGNKIIAACASLNKGGTVFLDTDVIISKPFNLDEIVEPGTIAAAPEGRKTWGKEQFGEDWRYIYESFHLSVPLHKVRLERTGVLSYPYYNAGVIAFSDLERAKKRFPCIWMDTALAMDADEKIPSKRPWLDQVSLPIAAARANMPVRTLDVKWNLSLSRRQDSAPEISRINSVDPNIIHYHRLHFFQGTRFSDVPDNLIKEFTVFDSMSHLTEHLDCRQKKIKEFEYKLNSLRKVPKANRSEADRKEMDRLRILRRLAMSESMESTFEKWPGNISR